MLEAAHESAPIPGYVDWSHRNRENIKASSGSVPTLFQSLLRHNLLKLLVFYLAGVEGVPFANRINEV